jgi:hypothetical protein
MVNHFRTLLLNIVPPAGLQAGTFGEEYIEPGFAPLQLYGRLLQAHEALVPARAPRASQNFYAYALLRLAGAPDFSKYVTTFDSRLAYDLDTDKYLSADQPRSAWPQFSIMALYTGLSGAMMSPGGTGLFDMAPAWSADMAVFRDVWYGNFPYREKVTAGMMATVYAMEGARTNGGSTEI